jgi:hypothetical protein
MKVLVCDIVREKDDSIGDDMFAETYEGYYDEDQQ